RKPNSWVILAMPTVLRVGPFRVIIFLPPREHRPPHVHVQTAASRGSPTKTSRQRSGSWNSTTNTCRRVGGGTMAKRRTPKAAILRQIPAARARDRRERSAGRRALSAYYDRATQHVMMELTSGHVFGFPARSISS